MRQLQEAPCKGSSATCRPSSKLTIQCDESMPCANCVRRGENCQLPSRHIEPLPPLQQVSSRTTTDEIGAKLLHHFIAFTIDTLPFPDYVWKHTLQLTPQFDFLQDIVLGISARHLSVLQPEVATHHAAASKYLSRTLFRFRKALSKDLASNHIDAFVATSFLLQHEVWASGELPTVSNDETTDPLFIISASLKGVFLKCLCKAPRESSVFVDHLPRDPARALSQAPQMGVLDKVERQNLFSATCPINSELPGPLLTGHDYSQAVSEECRCLALGQGRRAVERAAPLIKHLSMILAFLPDFSTYSIEAQRTSQLWRDLSLYIFSFPVRCRSYFTGDAEPQDHQCRLLLLYHFYRAVRILLRDKQFWWAQGRVRASEALLKSKLLQSHQPRQLPLLVTAC